MKMNEFKFLNVNGVVHPNRVRKFCAPQSLRVRRICKELAPVFVQPNAFFFADEKGACNVLTFLLQRLIHLLLLKFTGGDEFFARRTFCLVPGIPCWLYCSRLLLPATNLAFCSRRVCKRNLKIVFIFAAAPRVCPTLVHNRLLFSFGLHPLFVRSFGSRS